MEALFFLLLVEGDFGDQLGEAVESVAVVLIGELDVLLLGCDVFEVIFLVRFLSVLFLFVAILRVLTLICCFFGDLVLALWVLLDFSGLFLCFNLFAGLLLWLGLRVLDLFLL